MKENLLKETQQAHNKPFSCNIVLIGFMGAGKSTVSEYLSRKYNMDTVEMDQIIAEREKMSISDIFSVHGEEYFRDLETNLLIEMQAKTNTVISCGLRCSHEREKRKGNEEKRMRGSSYRCTGNDSGAGKR